MVRWISTSTKFAWEEMGMAQIEQDSEVRNRYWIHKSLARDPGNFNCSQLVKAVGWAALVKQTLPKAKPVSQKEQRRNSLQICILK